MILLLLHNNTRSDPVERKGYRQCYCYFYCCYCCNTDRGEDVAHRHQKNKTTFYNSKNDPPPIPSVLSPKRGCSGNSLVKFQVIRPEIVEAEKGVRNPKMALIPSV